MATITDKRMKSIKEKAEEYAKMKHTDKNLIDIVSWDFEAGANYVLEQIENILQDKKTGLVEMWDELMTLVEQLKGNQ